MTITFELDNDLRKLEVEGEVELTESEYGWTISSLEWQLDIRFTHRQDSHTSWAVLLTEVDGEVTIKSGLSPTLSAKGSPREGNLELPADLEIRNAIQELTSHWITPIRVIWVEVVIPGIDEVDLPV